MAETDLMDAGGMPPGAKRDRARLIRALDRLEDGFAVVGKTRGRLTLLAINGVQVHGRRGWTEDGAEP